MTDAARRALVVRDGLAGVAEWEARHCVNPAVYDAGALVAADRNPRSMWAEHRVRLEAGVIPCVPAPVIAQVSTSGRHAQLRRFLRGCNVIDFRAVDAHARGRLLARSRTSDIVDAAVVLLATDRAAEIVTADRADITHLLVAARVSLPIVDT